MIEQIRAGTSGVAGVTSRFQSVYPRINTMYRITRIRLGLVAQLSAVLAVGASQCGAQYPVSTDSSTQKELRTLSGEKSTPQPLVHLISTNGNPLLSSSQLPFQAPDFGAIRHAHYQPAYEAGMAGQIKEVELISSSTAPPTFDNTIAALDKTGTLLSRVENIFSNMAAAHTDETIQKIQADMAPKLAAHADNIFLNKALFKRIETLYLQRDQLGLSVEQRELLKKQFERCVRAGAKLDDAAQKKIRELNEQLSSLTTKYQESLLAVTKEIAVIVEDAAHLEGMDAADIAAAAEAAKSRGAAGKYLLAITNTTRQPVLTSLKNRALRQRVWEASANRGLGRNGAIDLRPLIRDIAKRRAERATLLGYANHAAFALENQMAKEPAAALAMLTDLLPTLMKKVRAEADDIRSLMKSEGAAFELMPWDWEYYAEKVRKAKYSVDENEVRPYLELDSVLRNGVFYTMRRLYGVEFRERKDLPVYLPDVRVFDVIDRNGQQLGLFYADYFQRESKRGGAWMSSFVDQSHLLKEKAVVMNVMNIPKPATGEPALITFDQATTMFHEMGHALHGLFSEVTYPTLSGTSVPRDFVEFPSTFHEDWAIHPEVLANFAKHHKTGQPMPKQLLDKILAAAKFNQGFDTLEYVAAALLDLQWHTLAANSIPEDLEQFEAQSLAKFGVDFQPVPPRYRTAYFQHIWAGGYSASYYAYLWSEVLAADAFDFLRTTGGLTDKRGKLFRDKILSRGGSQEPMSLYTDFRGEKPQVRALLVRRGLAENN